MHRGVSQTGRMLPGQTASRRRSHSCTPLKNEGVSTPVEGSLRANSMLDGMQALSL